VHWLEKGDVCGGKVPKKWDADVNEERKGD
jgi:hypothetical protein